MSFSWHSVACCVFLKKSVYQGSDFFLWANFLVAECSLYTWDNIRRQANNRCNGQDEALLGVGKAGEEGDTATDDKVEAASMLNPH